ncbi:MAG TPA: hypothetical protein VKA53_10645 [Thermoanaerobaculia bacterium]|nr:hypothetical protein [Thermoanaerobaculia bacterium]
MNQSSRKLRLALTSLGAVALVLVASAPLHAVPVFARKYHTSCQTCHAIFPKLNPFGEAFRLNGFRMPGETAQQVKQKPVSMGAPAYKQMWPRMVYPSDIPGNAPIAINVQMANVYASSHDATGELITHNDFQMPQEANLFSAGTLGQHFSFFGELTFAQNPDGSSDVEIEHAELHVNSPFGPKHAVNFKVGKFAPDLADGFQEMWIMTANGIDTMFNYNPIGIHGGTGLAEDGGGISIPAMVQGLEMYGVVKHRLFYTVGLTNGLGPGSQGTYDGNSSKDVYARVGYKFGGMGLDGDTKGVNLPPENWAEKSLRVGLLSYFGNGTGTNFPVNDALGNSYNMQDRHFNRVGLFASWYWNNLNVFGVYLRGRDTLDLLSSVNAAKLSQITPSYNAWLTEADYVITPPFQVSMRYEQVQPGDSRAQKIEELNTNFSFLERANIKAMLEYRRDLQDGKNFELDTVLRFAY